MLPQLPLISALGNFTTLNCSHSPENITGKLEQFVKLLPNNHLLGVLALLEVHEDWCSYWLHIMSLQGSVNCVRCLVEKMLNFKSICCSL